MSYDPKYKVYTWKHGLMLHWILNPGLFINELIFGQRVPKVSLLDTSVDKPRIERTYVPCPHCDTIHDGRTWSTTNGTVFQNWFGLYCHSCGGIIPCLTNVVSFLLLAVSFPIWGWFKENLKEQWLSKQASRFKNLDLDTIPNPFDGKGWIKVGLGWGAFMFVFMVFVFPWFSGEEITMAKILIGIPVWTLGGLGFGYSMKKWSGKKGVQVDTSLEK